MRGNRKQESSIVSYYLKINYLLPTISFLMSKMMDTILGS